MPNINIPVDEELHRRLRVAAAEDGLKMTDVVREALAEWLDERDSETDAQRRALLQRRREARRAFQAGEITAAERISAERDVRKFRQAQREAREAAAAAGDGTE
jgi:DNA-binding protein H-NS